MNVANALNPELSSSNRNVAVEYINNSRVITFPTLLRAIILIVNGVRFQASYLLIQSKLS